MESPKPQGNRRLRWILLVSSLVLTVILSAIYLFNPEFIQYPILKSTDLIFGTANAPVPAPQVVAVSIDEASLGKYGQWPWPRYRFAQLLEAIKQQRPATIGINIIFPEADRTSPITWQKTIKQDFGYVVDTSAIPAEILDHDTYLASTLKDGPFIMGYEFLFHRTVTSPKEHNLPPVSLSRKGHSGSPAPPTNFHQAEGVICNYQVLGRAVSRAGFLNGTPDIDGVLRRLPLLIEFDEKVFPSFALGVLMQLKHHDQLILQKDNMGITHLSLADVHIPTDGRGNFLLSPVRQDKSEYFSAADVLEGKSPLGSFTDKIVLVGLTAPGLTQLYPTPLLPSTPLLDIHKHSIQSLLSLLHTIRTPIFPIYEALTSFLLCLLLALCIAYLPTIWSVVLCLLAAFSTWIAAAVIFQNSGILFSPLLPTVSAVLNCCLLVTLKFRHFQHRASSETRETLILLKSNEKNLQSILKSIPDIIFRLDQNGRFTFVSTAIYQYAISPRALIGSSIFEIVSPTDLDKAHFRLNERRTGEGATTDLEIQLQLTKSGGSTHEDHRYFSISTRGIYHTRTNGLKYFLGTQGIIRDITDRKHIENQLMQAQKMEVVGNLAAGIAHDLNNILSGLVSYPDLLLMEIPENDPLHKKISVIQKSGKKAAAIVQDLLTLARRNIDISDVYNMNDIITEYLGSMEFERVKTRFPAITLHTDLQDNLLNGKGSGIHLSKVIMNILHNGMEAMPAGGDINISTCNIYVDTCLEGYEPIPQGEYSCTSIADNGVGIPKTDLNRIFEPFYTKKSMAKSGTGLGMTVIWATIKDHGGYLDIESDEGQGTTLKIYLPTTREEAGAPQSRIVLDDYVGSESILVVDDIPQQLDIAQKMLSKLGYNVFTASSGEHAIETIERQPVDLVILDMIMPLGLDGLETYIKISRLYRNQKAIVTSGFSESERVKTLQTLGVKCFVQKPYSMEKLGMAVREELDRITDHPHSELPEVDSSQQFPEEIK